MVISREESNAAWLWWAKAGAAACSAQQAAADRRACCSGRTVVIATYLPPGIRILLAQDCIANPPRSRRPHCRAVVRGGTLAPRRLQSDLESIMTWRTRMTASVAASWLAVSVVGAAEPAEQKAEAKPAATASTDKAKDSKAKSDDKKKDLQCTSTTGSRIRRDP